MEERLLIEENRSYLSKDKVSMTLRIVKPTEWQKGDRRTCILFYFGGGFVKRNLAHFKRQGEYFAKLGCVCVHADYRLASETMDLRVCHDDALSALEAVVEQADELGIDPARIIVCGGSAGGELACAVNFASNLPCAQVLFNPLLFHGEQGVFLINRKATVVQINEEKTTIDVAARYAQCWGEEYARYPQHFSAYHLLDGKQLPPTLILQGTADPITYRGVILFHQKAIELGWDCTCVLYEGETHGFFNYERSEDKFCYTDTLKQMEIFIKERKLI